MSLIEADKLACNKIIGNAVGVEPEHYCGKLMNVPTKLARELCLAGDCVACGYYHKRYPNFCGDDAAALEGIKALQEKGIRTECRAKPAYKRDFLSIPKRWDVFLYHGNSDEAFSCNGFKPAKTLATALKDAMVEEHPEPIVDRERRPGDKEPEKEWCLRPALEAVLKGKK